MSESFRSQENPLEIVFAYCQMEYFKKKLNAYSCIGKKNPVKSLYFRKKLVLILQVEYI